MLKNGSSQSQEIKCHLWNRGHEENIENSFNLIWNSAALACGDGDQTARAISGHSRYVMSVSATSLANACLPPMPIIHKTVFIDFCFILSYSYTILPDLLDVLLIVRPRARRYWRRLRHIDLAVVSLKAKKASQTSEASDCSIVAMEFWC